MKRKAKKALARRARELRWWLLHHAGCAMCHFELAGEFSRDWFAVGEACGYDGPPVRVPRRFWPVLGRWVTP